ncbi:tRNA (guanine-N(1)-)-methyltransferase [Nitrosomonas stercoris]|uniref:tRNA (guanine-N(1)-)-methyltransferase n=1 Tax=Nitrosomonas stercoris TaxID=1444684 RepID=A0A4Y1YPL1_9PROT|nr:tRNA (guanine-N(1)-)-methyltransferase [Nitrosomonas stercoris]
MALEFDVITLLPEMFCAITKFGITGKANRNKLYHLHTWNPRNYATNHYRTVDDAPYGGGPGMVMMAQPLDQAITDAKTRQTDTGIKQTHVIYLSPQGQCLDHEKILQLSQLDSMILLCGRYEGIDERLIEEQVDEEISLGDYVISGGELAAMVLIDAVIRQLPGALGDMQSANQDSHVAHLLEYPHYTRPDNYKGKTVPEVLLSGNHARIERWRQQQSIGRTWLKRPDLLTKKYPAGLPDKEKELLEEFKQLQHLAINQQETDTTKGIGVTK